MSALSTTRTLSKSTDKIDVILASVRDLCECELASRGDVDSTAYGSDPHRLSWSAAMALTSLIPNSIASHSPEATDGA